MEVSNNDAPKKFSDLIVEYVSKNPFLTLWSIAGIIGGLFGFCHYVRVGYVPEIDIKTAGTILISLALTGSMFTILIAIIFLVPAFYLRSVIEEKKILVIPDIPIDPIELEQKKQRRRIVLTVLRASILALGLYSLLIGFISDETISRMGFIAVGAFIVTVTTFFRQKLSLVYHQIEKWQITSYRLKPVAQFRVVHGDFIVATTIWIFAFFLVFVMVLPFFIRTDDWSTTQKAFWLLGLLLVMIISNLTLSIPGIGKNKRYAIPILGMFVFLPMVYFLAMPYSELNLEKVTFNKLGLGSLKDSLFLVNLDTCDAVNIIRENTCVQVSRKENKGELKDEIKKLGCIRPKYLENRLGSEYLIAFEDPEPQKTDAQKKNKWILIPLQKKDVIMWAFGEEIKSVSAQCKTSSDASKKV